MAAKADIEAAIAVGVDVLVLDGKTLAVHAVAQIVATLVIVRLSLVSLLGHAPKLIFEFVGHHCCPWSCCQSLRFRQS